MESTKNSKPPDPDPDPGPGPGGSGRDLDPNLGLRETVTSNVFLPNENAPTDATAAFKDHNAQANDAAIQEVMNLLHCNSSFSSFSSTSDSFPVENLTQLSGTPIVQADSQSQSQSQESIQDLFHHPTQSQSSDTSSSSSPQEPPMFDLSSSSHTPLTTSTSMSGDTEPKAVEMTTTTHQLSESNKLDHQEDNLPPLTPKPISSQKTSVPNQVQYDDPPSYVVELSSIPQHLSESEQIRQPAQPNLQTSPEYQPGKKHLRSPESDSNVVPHFATDHSVKRTKDSHCDTPARTRPLLARKPRAKATSETASLLTSQRIPDIPTVAITAKAQPGKSFAQAVMTESSTSTPDTDAPSQHSSWTPTVKLPDPSQPKSASKTSQDKPSPPAELAQYLSDYQKGPSSQSRDVAPQKRRSSRLSSKDSFWLNPNLYKPQHHRSKSANAAVTTTTTTTVSPTNVPPSRSQDASKHQSKARRTSKAQSNATTAPTSVAVHSSQQSTQPSGQQSTPPPITTQPKYKCPSCFNNTPVNGGSIAVQKEFASENDLYEHVIGEHCFDGETTFHDDTIANLNFEKCPKCYRLFKRGRIHVDTRCRVHASRDKTLSVSAENHRKLFREKFHNQNFDEIRVGTGTLSYEELLQSKAPTLNYMPGSEEMAGDFRKIFVAIVRCLLRKLATQPNYQNTSGYSNLWSLILSLPRLLLSLPADKSANKVSTAAAVNERLTKCFNGDFPALYQEHKQLLESLNHNRPHRNNPDATVRQVISTIKTSGDLSRAARRLQSNMGLADVNLQETQNEIRKSLLDDLSEQTFRANIPVSQQTPALSSELISQAVATMSKSAAGITGWHATHFAAITATSDGLQALTAIVNIIYSGEMPALYFGVLNTSVLVPLRKPNGGIRPILIGDCFVRLIGKCVSTLEQHAISQVLEPIQVAVGTKSGNEVAIHGIRAHLESHPDQIAIAIDFKNAFGTINRKAIAEALDHMDPLEVQHTKCFFNLFVTAPSNVLQSNKTRFQYSAGVPQGGPLSMQLFCLALHPLLTKLHYQLQQTNGSVIAYADDVYLLGTPSEVQEAYQALSTVSPNIGLSINPTKCQVLALDTQTMQMATQMCQTLSLPSPADAINILGSAVGTQAGELRIIQQIDETELFERISQVYDLQCRLLLIRQCIVSKFQHYGRTLPPDVSSNLLQSLDMKTRMAMADILGEEELSDQTWLETTLPISHGGLGIRELHTQAQTDYYASASFAMLRWRNILPDNHPLISSIINNEIRSADCLTKALSTCHQLKLNLLQTVIRPTNTDAAAPEEHLPAIKNIDLPKDVRSLMTSTTPCPIKLQHYLSSLHARCGFRSLWNSINPQSEHRIMILSKTTGTPMIPLAIIPTEPGLVFSNIETRFILRHLMSLSLEETIGLPSRHIRCSCSSPFSTKQEHCSGIHLFNCKSQGAFVVRHTAIMNVVASAFKSVNLTPTLEKPVQTAPNIGAKNNRLSLKRYDIYAQSADSNGKMLCLDVSVTSHVTQEYLANAKIKPLVNASNTVTAKINKYSKHIHRETETFVPLVAETSGVLHKHYFKLYNHLGTRVNGEPPLQASWAATTFAAYWMQRTSAVLWRETARSLQRIANESNRRHGDDPDGAIGLINPVIEESEAE